jgi:hypothetical protein
MLSKETTSKIIANHIIDATPKTSSDDSMVWMVIFSALAILLLEPILRMGV